MSDNQEEKKSTAHKCFADIFKTSLTPLNIEVKSEYTVEKKPVRMDVLIIRKEKYWTKEQLTYIPDGLRETQCKHIILELKRTESINIHSTRQIISYLTRYLDIQSLPEDDVQPCLISAMTPQKQTMENLDYEPTKLSGVYESKNVLAGNLKLLSANDLSDAPHNVWIKLFASKKKEKLSALTQLMLSYKNKLSEALSKVVMTILNYWHQEGEYTMEELMKDVSHMDIDPVEFIARYIKPEKLSKMYNLQPKEVFQIFPMKPKDIFEAYPMKPEEIFRANPMKPEEIFDAYPDKKELMKSIEKFYKSMHKD
jgi:hypothetical protein